MRNDTNTQCHGPSFNKSPSSLPARQQVVIGYVDQQFVVPDLIKPTSIVKASGQDQACNIRPSVGRESEMTVDIACTNGITKRPRAGIKAEEAEFMHRMCMLVQVVLTMRSVL